MKKFIAVQDAWSKGRKQNVVKAYSLFLRMQGRVWDKPKYKPVEKLPFIPTEKEIDDLIAGCSKQIAAFLKVLKETGARRGEVFNLKWTDVDLVRNTLRITPEKGSRPRIFKISDQLVEMLGKLSKNSERIWNYSSQHNLDRSYARVLVSLLL